MTAAFAATADEPSWLQILREGGVVVLTGAGVSTDSGIPDYRDDAGRFKHAKPIDYRDFVAGPDVRRRYWARSMVGYEHLKDAQPNPAHRALCELERAGATGLLITQNVDGLHERAGSREVLDLHGRIDRVVCLDCGQGTSRAALQGRLLASNPAWSAPARHRIAPDGDADLTRSDFDDFAVPACVACGGVLKPDVVFFGEHVPADRSARAAAAVARARALLVVGSSLMVWSGYRFVRQAAAANIPVLVINRGTTRADSVARLRLQGNAGDLLTALAQELLRSTASVPGRRA